MRKIIASSVLATSVLLPFNVLADVPSTKYTVSIDTDVRKGATMQYEVVSKLHRGQSATVIDEFTNSNGEIWYRVDLNSLKGWVPASTLTEIEDQKNLVGFNAVVTENSVNIRKGPGTENGVLTQLNKGQAVSVKDVEKNSKGEVWYRISSNSIDGWIIENYLALQTAVGGTNSIDGKSYVGTLQKIGAKPATMRSGATDSYVVTATISANTSLQILDAFTNTKEEVWFNVSYSGKKGWVKSDQFALSPSGSNNGSVADGSKYEGTTQRIGKNAGILRSGATSSYPVKSSVPATTAIKIVDSFKNAQNEVWFNVSYNGVKGWIIAEQFVLSDQGIVDDNHTIDGKSYIGTTQVLGNVNTNMQSGATTSYKVVGLVPAKSSLKIRDAFTNAKKEVWFNVEYQGKRGWILSDLFNLSTAGNSSVQKKIVVNQSKIHSGATTAYKTVYTVAPGTTLSIYQEFINASGEKWYNVSYAPGKKGWIQASAFEKVSSTPETPTTPVEKTVNLRVSVAVANMRSGPGLSYDVIAQSKLNDYFVSSDVAEDSNHEKWYKVHSASGIDAWLHQSVVEVNAVIPTTTDTIQTYRTTLYKDASFASAAVTALAQKTKISVIGTTEAGGIKWLNVAASSGHTGWIPEFETMTNLPTKFAKTKISIYSGANTKYKVIDTVAANGAVNILYSLNGWYNVETPNKQRGWVQAANLADVSPIQLMNGRQEVRNGQNYLVWTKPSNFSVSYNIPSKNVLRIYGNLSDVDRFDTSIPGVVSVAKERVSGGTAVLLITLDPKYTFTVRNYKNELTVKVIPKGIQGKKIIIDAGHGDHDPGAVGKNGTKEKDVVLSTALLLKRELEMSGAQVVLTRSTDKFLQLSQRTDISNASDYDAFVSIHANSAGSTSANGTETFYYKPTFNNPKSYELASYVQKGLLQTTGRLDRKVQSKNLHVLRENELPSILVELAFLSNPTEEKLLASEAYRKNAAIGIKNGLANYFNN